jgi:hypothetical protein
MAVKHSTRREARRNELGRVAGKGRVRPGCKGGEVGLEHLMAVARQIWNWAIVEGYVEVTPFKRGGVSVIRVKTGASSPRTRRLNDDEETRLMSASSPSPPGLDHCGTGNRLSSWRTLVAPVAPGPWE